jgi:hypothetical protein
MSERCSSRLVIGSSITTIFWARCGSRSSDAKKEASARVFRSPALKVLRKDGPGLLPEAKRTDTVLISTLYEQAEPARVFIEVT